MAYHYFYEREIKELNKSRLRYLVIGGVAVNLYGLHRLTLDLDLIIDLSKNSLNEFIRVMGGLGYRTKVPKSAWGKHAAIAFHSRKEEDKRIDVFLKNPIDFNSAYKKRKLFRVEKGFYISCVSFKDLLSLKKKADRLRDWIDIGSLKRMKELGKNEP
ncbi:MAG: hypothetical protein ABH860_00280 [bacterium]